MKYLPQLIDDLDKCKYINHSEFSNAKYEMKNLESLFEKYCPFKKGDKITIVKEIDFEKSWGWAAYKHILVPGCVGTIDERLFYDNHFVFCVEIMVDTYISSLTNKPEPSYDPGPKFFYFGEEYLKL